MKAKVAAIAVLVGCLFTVSGHALSFYDMPVPPGLEQEKGPNKLTIEEKASWSIVQNIGDDFLYGKVVVEGKGVLTIQKNCDVEMSGPMDNSGSIINYGTIVVQDKLSISDTASLVNHGKIIVRNSGYISNAGTFTNYGNMVIENEGMANSARSSLVNEGSITVQNSQEGSIGLICYAYNDVTGTEQKGNFVNKGTIIVANTAGTGIELQQGVTLNNQGEVNQNKGAIIKGQISGNAVISGE